MHVLWSGQLQSVYDKRTNMRIPLRLITEKDSFSRVSMAAEICYEHDEPKFVYHELIVTSKGYSWKFSDDHFGVESSRNDTPGVWIDNPSNGNNGADGAEPEDWFTIFIFSRLHPVTLRITFFKPMSEMEMIRGYFTLQQQVDQLTRENKVLMELVDHPGNIGPDFEWDLARKLLEN